MPHIIRIGLMTSALLAAPTLARAVAGDSPGPTPPAGASTSSKSATPPTPDTSPPPAPAPPASGSRDHSVSSASSAPASPPPNQASAPEQTDATRAPRNGDHNAPSPTVPGPHPNAAADADSDADADATMRQMMKLRQPSPIVAPENRSGATSVPSRVGVAAPNVDINPAILGIAPGEPTPQLQREGTFIVSRRGRLVRSADGGHELFVFEADSKSATEPPMILQACRLLETMEDVVQQRNDSVVFVVSGQVHTYRGANYLMPTMMKIAVNRGNLHP